MNSKRLLRARVWTEATRTVVDTGRDEVTWWIDGLGIEKGEDVYARVWCRGIFETDSNDVPSFEAAWKGLAKEVGIKRVCKPSPE